MKCSSINCNIRLFVCLFLFLFLFFHQSIYAQKTESHSISGKVADSGSIGNVENAAVSLLRAKDSIMVTTVRSNIDGAFKLNVKDTGAYILLVTYPNYVDYVQKIRLITKEEQLTPITITSTVSFLKEVIVKQTVAAIRIKGDTTEFAADSFKVQPNATVEDLLKKLPMIQIDKDGKITAQGKSVPKVLLDGEEFFGSDPTLVTRNLRADMIDKVQLYDRKSDQANFTGIDDGERTKTINLKLKEDKKKGYFGKIELGGGNNGFHQNQLLFNKFKKKEKISGYSIVSNTGKTRLDWDDGDKYGFSNGVTTMDDNGNTMTYFSSGDDGWDGNGIPLIQTGGLHYGNKWNEDKTALNANLKTGRQSVTGTTSTTTQNNLPTSVLYSNSYDRTKKISNKSKADIKFNQDLDSTLSLTIGSANLWSSSHENSLDTSITMRQDSSLVNTGYKTQDMHYDNNNFDANVMLQKKLKKKGRTLSFSAFYNSATNKSNGYLHSLNRFYDTSSFTNAILLDQHKLSDNKSSSLRATLSYSEPLAKTLNLFVNYGITTNNNNSDVRSYNRDTLSSEYTVLDSNYSNHYIYDQFSHRGGLSFSYFKNGIRINIGTNVMSTEYTQKDKFRSVELKRHFVNWNPNLYTNFKLGTQRSLSFRYNGTMRQPTINQIQPLASNNDPLNISLGNAHLRPSFNHNFDLWFSDYKVLTESNLYLDIEGNIMNNNITTNTITDSLTGRNTFQYVNVSGNKDISLYGNYNFKLRQLKMFMGIRPNMSWQRNVNFVNGQRNVGNAYNLSIGVNFSKQVDSLLDVSLELSPRYSINTSSVQSSNNVSYWAYQIEPNADFFLPLHCQIHTDLNYSYRQQSRSFTKNSVCLWNAWVGKKLLPKDQLLIKISGNDLLNQNRGIYRNMTNNIITQTINSTIKRYFLISAVWNFTGGMAAN